MTFIVSVKPNEIIKENQEIKFKKKYENLSLISSFMLRKLRLSQKKVFLLKKEL